MMACLKMPSLPVNEIVALLLLVNAFLTCLVTTFPRHPSPVNDERKGSYLLPLAEFMHTGCPRQPTTHCVLSMS